MWWVFYSEVRLTGGLRVQRVLFLEAGRKLSSRPAIIGGLGSRGQQCRLRVGGRSQAAFTGALGGNRGRRSAIHAVQGAGCGGW